MWLIEFFFYIFYIPLAMGEKLYDEGKRNITCVDFVKEVVERKLNANSEVRPEIKCFCFFKVISCI
jgi:ribosomal protein L31E